MLSVLGLCAWLAAADPLPPPPPQVYSNDTVLATVTGERVAEVKRRYHDVLRAQASVRLAEEDLGLTAQIRDRVAVRVGTGGEMHLILVDEQLRPTPVERKYGRNKRLKVDAAWYVGSHMLSRREARTNVDDQGTK